MAKAAQTPETGNDELQTEIRKLALADIENHGATTIPDADSKYLPLMQVLADAYAQAADGKGNRRHGAGKPFLEQPILEIVRMQGASIDGHTYQIMKKAQEAGRMVTRDQLGSAVQELFGIINYAAAAVIRIREIETESIHQNRSAE